MQTSTAILISLFVLVVLAACVWVARLTRGGIPQAPDQDSIKEERDRLLVQIQSERAALTTVVGENGRLSGSVSALQESLRHATADLADKERQLQAATERLNEETVSHRTAKATLSEKDLTITGLRTQVESLSNEAEVLRHQLTDMTAKHADAAANLLHASRANEQMREFLTQAQSKLSAAFAELAGKTLDERAVAMQNSLQQAAAASRGDLDLLLRPFSQRLVDFQVRVEALAAQESQERSALLGAVGELKTLNQDMADATTELTRALKGSSKVRGDWGELMLESVLRGSGLEEGVHYKRQHSTVDDDGNRLQPDVVVKLPDTRLVVIDSKVNLIAWQEAMNAEAPDAQNEALRRHSIALRQHVRDLSEKNYPKAVGQNALELTIAFVPIEGALSAALGFDAALQGEAFDRRIVFASPNTLMGLLRVVERLWTRDKVQRQAQEISDMGGLMLDSLNAFLKNFESVGKRLDDATTSFAEARRVLVTADRSVMARAKRLVGLGVRGKQDLPAPLLAEVLEEVTQEAQSERDAQ